MDEIAALFISPDRALAARFAAAGQQARCFSVVAELDAYPRETELEARLRQIRPQAVLVDVASDPTRAGTVIGAVARICPGVPVVGVHGNNDAEIILRALRQGAAEFLYAPFDPATQRQAADRIRRLMRPNIPEQRESEVIAFSSAKPGSGASTLAVQTAFALRSAGGKPVLLADMDVSRSIVAFYGTSAQGVEISDGLRAPRDLSEVRGGHRWVLVDLPPAFAETSQGAFPQCDRVYLVATPDLPSLHLARKAVSYMQRSNQGVPCEVLLNRVEKRRVLDHREISRAIGAEVRHTFPNELFAVERALTGRERIAGDTSLGRTISYFAAGILRRAAAAPPARRT